MENSTPCKWKQKAKVAISISDKLNSKTKTGTRNIS